MTAEQILEKHLLLMLKRTDESYVSIDEMKQQPEWQAAINAMIEYGETQALRIHDVVGQSEQVVCPECGDASCISKIYNTHECFTCGEKFKAN